MKSKNYTLNQVISYKKLPWIITISFFIILLTISTIHHPHWINAEADGMYFLNVGKQILSGDAESVKLYDAPVGGPIIYASLESLLHDGFNIEKTISLLSGTGIVFFSYYIIRNFFGAKIALVGQLFVAFSPRLEILSMTAVNILLPTFLVFAGLYFLTKERTVLLDYALVGIFLGASFMIRYQALPILLGVLIFILIRNKKIKTNIGIAAIVLIFFIFAAAPLFAYNLITYDKLIDSEPNLYPILMNEYKTPQWNEYMVNAIITNESTAIFHDLELFFKNYFHNLFYQNPSTLFNFGTLSNASVIPIIPFIVLIPVFGGVVYLMKLENKKKQTYGLCIVLLISISIIVGTESPEYLYILLLFPIIFLIFCNHKKIKTNILALLVIVTIYSLFMAIVPLGSAELVASIWIFIPAMVSLFFVDVIKEIAKKFTANLRIINKTSKYFSIFFIGLILLMNLGVATKSFENTFYTGTFSSFEDEIFETINGVTLEKQGLEDKIIGNILKEQNGIENSYVIGNSVLPTYYANSKFVFTSFYEGRGGGTMNEFVNQENWSDLELHFSNVNSYPSNREKTQHENPDYLFFINYYQSAGKTMWCDYPPIHDYVCKNDRIESLEPGNPSIPSNFETLYYSNETGTVLYKIHHDE